jgi:vacuolar-type H+-ATPase subunit H
MKVESIKKVRDAEEEAEDLIDGALEQADRLISDGRSEASGRVAAAEARARREGEELRRGIMEEAEKEVMEIKEEAEARRQSINRIGQWRIGRAVEAVLDALEQ